MESNISSQDAVQAEGPLVEPHFDEEATLLSAQPVVPLEEVQAEERSGRRLAFGLAILAGLVIGALGATLAYKQFVNKQSSATQVVEQEPQQQQPLDSTIAGGVANDLPDSAPAPVETESPVQKVVQETPKPRPERDAKPDDVDDDDDEKELRRAERRAARRQRRQEERAARRESRANQSQPNDDLLRIREIFEGSPRP